MRKRAYGGTCAVNWRNKCRSLCQNLTRRSPQLSKVISVSRAVALDAAYECRLHGRFRRAAGRNTVQIERLERR